MAAVELLITDVTEMNRRNYCVAGWDVHELRMRRPLPGGRNWSAYLLHNHEVAPGATIEVTPAGVATGTPPHRTEDMPVDASEIELLNSDFCDWLGPNAPETFPNLNAAFDGNLQYNGVWNGAMYGVHVLTGTQCRSLAALQVGRDDVSFTTDDKGKLRAVIFDGSSAYQLAVSSKQLNEAFRIGDIDGLDDVVPTRAMLHARIGLARAFGNSPKCYAMLNGLL